MYISIYQPYYCLSDDTIILMNIYFIDPFVRNSPNKTVIIIILNSTLMAERKKHAGFRSVRTACELIVCIMNVLGNNYHSISESTPVVLIIVNCAKCLLLISSIGQMLFRYNLRFNGYYNTYYQ